MKSHVHADGKTRVLLLTVVFCNVVGNSLLSFGMREFGRLDSFSAAQYLLALFQPAVAAGTLCVAVSFCSQATLLSWADLSYVVPVTAVAYIATALVGQFVLGEQISPMRWAGIMLIAGGVRLVSQTPPRGDVLDRSLRSRLRVRPPALPN